MDPKYLIVTSLNLDIEMGKSKEKIPFFEVLSNYNYI